MGKDDGRGKHGAETESEFFTEGNEGNEEVLVGGVWASLGACVFGEIKKRRGEAALWGCERVIDGWDFRCRTG